MTHNSKEFFVEMLEAMDEEKAREYIKRNLRELTFQKSDVIFYAFKEVFGNEYDATILPKVEPVVETPFVEEPVKEWFPKEELPVDEFPKEEPPKY